MDNLSTPAVECGGTRDATWTFYSGSFIHRLIDVSLTTVEFLNELQPCNLGVK